MTSQFGSKFVISSFDLTFRLVHMQRCLSRIQLGIMTSHGNQECDLHTFFQIHDAVYRLSVQLSKGLKGIRINDKKQRDLLAN